jgi:RHH-type proline utilization regulon transcriptional repressor/proline dehydrogenase/delta 1-pyrroline-5-carboxylate dehydrogenase
VLEEALKTLEPGESWAVMPRPVGDNPHLWSPGVKYGVTPGSITHRTEFFGPLLGVMRFEQLSEAIDLVNATGYGLTSAIHSLDDREVEEWKAGIQAGNLYVNRGTTGAVVLRQPFGGMGLSCYGPGLKAGGPNYVAGLMQFRDADLPATPIRGEIENPDLAALGAWLDASRVDDARLLRALVSYDRAWRDEFSREHDHLRLLGQDNVRRYLPLPEICVRITSQDTHFDRLARIAAARVTGARVLASFAPNCPKEWRDTLDEWTESWAGGIEILKQTDEELLAELEQPLALRIRFAGPDRVPAEIRKFAAQAGHWLADVPVVSEGLVELLWYVREQSVSHDYHRYGNLGVRALETRRPLVGQPRPSKP